MPSTDAVDMPLAKKLEDLQQEIETVQAAMSKNAEKAAEYQALIDKASSVQKQALEGFQSHSKKLSRAEKRLQSLEQEAGSNTDVEEALKRCQASMEVASAQAKVVHEVQPENGSYFLRLFLGRINVKSYMKYDRDKIKSEVHQFRRGTNIVFLLIPILWALSNYFLRHLFEYTDWLSTVTHVWLLYYYVSLSLRENILKANGSRLDRWWIQHHYVSAFMSIVVLTWPRTQLYLEFTPYFTGYFLYQAVVQMLSAAYQESRFRARRALGKDKDMDGVPTDQIQEFHSGTYAIVALVTVAYTIQVAVGGLLLYKACTATKLLTEPWYRWTEEIQVVLLGLCFCTLACCNAGALYRQLKVKVVKAFRAAAAGMVGLARSGSGSLVMMGGGSMLGGGKGQREDQGGDANGDPGKGKVQTSDESGARKRKVAASSSSAT